jgi:hypothetical protein
MLNYNELEKKFDEELVKWTSDKLETWLQEDRSISETIQRVKKKLNLEAIPESTWVEKAKWRHKNQHWLDPSSKIAVKVLRWLRKNQITKEELAANLGYTEDYLTLILKGNEDLKLSTITELENITGLQFINII